MASNTMFKLLSFFTFIIIMTHGRPWNGEHSIMLNVTWRRFDQSAKQLVVGHATMKYLDVGLPTVHHLYIVSNMLVASD